jgi:hypothetical protein
MEHYSRRLFKNKVAWKSEPTPANRAKPLKINEIDATEEIEWNN